MTQLKFAVRTFTTDTTAKIVVISGFSDVPIINGLIVDSPSVVNVGSDSTGVTDSGDGAGAIALYSWTFTVQETLTANTSYPIVITQGAVDRSATVKTQPAMTGTDDFSVFFVSCDGGTSDTTTKGCYGYIKKFAEENNVAMLIHVDDHGYVDGIVPSSGTKLSDGITPLWNTLSRTSGTAVSNAYAYTVAYAAYLGLLDDYTKFHDTDRQWCHTNIPMLVGVGDHEMMDNPEESTNVTTAYLSDCLEAFRSTIGAGQEDTYLSATRTDLVAYIGPIEVIIYDRLFGLSPATRVYNPAASVQDSDGNSWLGATQISDIIAGLDTESPFKMMAMSTSAKMIMNKADRIQAMNVDGWSNTAFLGAQQPLHDYTDGLANSEFNDLMVNKSSGSIMDTANSYGAVVFGVHGDAHRTGEKYLYSGEDENNAQLGFYQFSAGSVNRRNSHPIHPDIVEGTSYQGVHQTYIPPWIRRVDGVGSTEEQTRNSCIRIDASKTSGDWILTVNIIEVDDTDSSANIAHQTVLKHGQSNYPEHLRKGFI